MKALSIKQPWAWLIVHGFKDIENRDWKIGRKPTCFGEYQNRGLELPSRVYVHAGKSSSDITNEVFAWIIERLNFGQRETFLRAGQKPTQIHLGAIVGEVDIVDCVTESDSPWFVGKYGFVLANPVAYKEPILYRGQLGFFEVNI